LIDYSSHCPTPIYGNNAPVTVGHAAFDAAILQYPGNRLALRKGIMLIGEHVPRVIFAAPG